MRDQWDISLCRNMGWITEWEAQFLRSIMNRYDYWQAFWWGGDAWHRLSPKQNEVRLRIEDKLRRGERCKR